MVVVIVLGLLLLSGFCISFYAKNYVNNHGKDIIGRNISVDDVSLNLFSGNLSVEKLAVYEQDNDSKFLTVDQIETSFSLIKLFIGVLNVDKLKLDGLNVVVTQADTVFNFTDIVDFFGTTEEEKVSDETPLPLVIKNIDIKNGNILYKDIITGGDFKLNDFSLIVPGVDLTNLNSLGADLKFVDGGKLTTSVQYIEARKKYDVTVELQNLNIASLLPLIQQYTNAKSVEGDMSSTLHIIGDTEHLMNFDISGIVSARNLSIMDENERGVIKSDSIGITVKSVDIQKNKIVLGNMVIVHPFLDFTIEKDSSSALLNMIEPLLVETVDPLAQTEENPLDLTISAFEIIDGEISYVDNTLKRDPFVYNISKVGGRAYNFNLNSSNRIVLSAVLNNKADGRLTYDGKLDDLSNCRIVFNADNIDISDFTPYSLHLFGASISEGTLSFKSQTNVTNNVLKSDVGLSFNNPVIGKRQKDIKPEFDVPLKLGMYCLKDRNGNIHIDVPVSGDIDNPEFSYKKILFKTFGNVILKVSTSPFRMFKSKNNNEEENNIINFNNILADFSAEEIAKFDTLKSLLSNSPELKIKTKLYISKKKADREIAEGALQRAYYITKFPEKADISLEQFDYDDLIYVDLNNPEVSLFANEIIAEQGIKIKSNTSISEMALALYGEKKSKGNIENFAKKKIADTKVYFGSDSLLNRIDFSYEIDSKKLESHYFMIEMEIE